jgi:DNA-binding GntR family transcriptional regulator
MDGRWYIEVAACAQSVRLTMQEMDLHVELGQLPWPPAHSPRLLDVIVDNHHAVVDAIEARDAARARALTEEHIEARTRWLIDMRLKNTDHTVTESQASSTGSPEEARA